MVTESVSALTFLQKIANWDGTSSQDIIEDLNAAFAAADYQGCIKNLEERGIDPTAYINNLDKVRPCSTPTRRVRLIDSEIDRR